jgi:hypothetical protein
MSAQKSHFAEALESLKSEAPRQQKSRFTEALKSLGMKREQPATGNFRSAFANLRNGFRERFGRDFTITGASDTSWHQKLHQGNARDVRVHDLTPEEGNWLITQGKAQGLDVRDFRTTWQEFGGSGPHIHIDIGKGQEVGESSFAKALKEVTQPKADWNPEKEPTAENTRAMVAELATNRHVKPVHGNVRVVGIDANKLSPGELKQKTLEAIGFTAEDARSEPFEFRTPLEQIKQNITPEGFLDIQIPPEEFNYLSERARLSQLRAAPMPNVDDLVISGHGFVDPMGGTVMQGSNQTIAQDPGQFLAPTPALEGKGGLIQSEALNQGVAERNASRKPHENVFASAARDVVAAAPGLLDLATRPFQYLSTLISGFERRAGAGIGSTVSETSAKALEEYGLRDIFDAAAERFYTGKIRPGYEQPVAELSRLAVERFGGNPDEALPRLLISTLEAGTDPVTYLGMKPAAKAASSAPGSFRAALDELSHTLAPVAEASAAKAPKVRDYTPLDRFRSRLSNLDFPGVYERKGGELGKEVSDLIRTAQVEIETRGANRAQVLDGLHDGVEYYAHQFEAGGQPGLAEAVRRHVSRIEGKPSAMEIELGNVIRSTPLKNVIKEPEQAFRDVLGVLRSVNHALRVRWNAKSVAVNELQPLLTLWPHARTSEFAEAMMMARRPAFRKRLAEMGVFESGSKVEGVANTAAPGAKGWLTNPFAKASETNRAVGYALGEIEGKRAGLTGEALHRRALDWAKQTEFDNSQWDVPDILSSPVGATLGQYKGFALKNVENLGRVFKYGTTDTPASWGKRVTKYSVALGAQGGIKAAGTTAAAGAIGVPAYALTQGLARVIQEQKIADGEDAEQMAEVIIYGAPAMGGIDLSASVAVLDEPFGDSLTDKAINSFGGPTVSTAVEMGKAGIDVIEAKSGNERESAFRKAVNKLTPYYRQIDTAKQLIGNRGEGATIEMGRDKIELTPQEAFMRALGFTPMKQTLYFQNKERQQDKREAVKQRKKTG